jgi:DNA-binding IclR family transcriptional regulator
VDEHEEEARLTTLQTADRVLEALFYLAEERDIGPTSLARHLRVSKATAHNLLQTLHKNRLADIDPLTQRYRLGPAVYRLSRGNTIYSEMLLLARPCMEHLRATFNETATLHGRTGHERVTLERIESTHVLRRTALVGERHPLHSGATGLVLLAWENPDELERYLAGPLEKATDHTLTDADTIREALAAIRAQGYALGEADPVIGVAAVSVPIFSGSGSILGALTLSGPSQRMTVTTLEGIAPVLRRSGLQLSLGLGYEGVSDELHGADALATHSAESDAAG